MNVLERIMAERRASVEQAKQLVALDALRVQALMRNHHSLKQRLAARGGRSAIMAEIKKASPSAGLLRPDYQPAEIARGYAEAGASGISVLTEPRHFMGSETDLRSVRAAADIPILRKDFMCDPYQVFEAAAWGADVVLLIAAALSDDELASLYATACELGLDVLAEVHDEVELRRVLPLEQAVIGVNSRNLKTLKTDLQTAHDLAGLIPAERLSIAESGIARREEVIALEAAGYDGFLIGEALLRYDDPAEALRILQGG